MLYVKCKDCNVELTSTNKSQCCGCPNLMTLLGDKISAGDLSRVVLLRSENSDENRTAFTKNDLEYQESRRKRKVRKLYFEVR